jgi:hypothetical protein
MQNGMKLSSLFRFIGALEKDIRRAHAIEFVMCIIQSQPVHLVCCSNLSKEQLAIGDGLEAHVMPATHVRPRKSKEKRGAGALGHCAGFLSQKVFRRALCLYGQRKDRWAGSKENWAGRNTKICHPRRSKD